MIQNVSIEENLIRERERGNNKNRPTVDTVGNQVGVSFGIMLAFCNVGVTSVLVSRISRLDS